MRDESGEKEIFLFLRVFIRLGSVQFSGGCCGWLASAA